MDFLLNDDVKALRTAARETAKKEIAPKAAEMDRREELDRGLWNTLAGLGYLGLCIPAEYGGMFAGHLAETVVMLEIGAACAGTATSLGASSGLFGGNVAANGTEEQKRRYLPRIASGEQIGCMGLTEPRAGSDAFSIATRAEKRGDRYILNGSKTFISNAPIADVALIYARLEPGRGTDALCAFIVEKGFTGYAAGPKMEKLGLRASPTGEIFLNDCEVPEENLVGMVPGRGFRQMISGLNVERVVWSAIAVGLAKAALRDAFDYSQERQQFGAALYSFQMTQDKIARMAMEAHLGEQSCLCAARQADEGQSFELAAAYCKLFCGEMVMRTTTEAVQIFGGNGCMRAYPVERRFRDAKVFAIGAGTSEIQKLLIAHRLLTKGLE